MSKLDKISGVLKKIRTPKLRIPKVIRNTLLSIVVLLLLFVGAGLAYTYFSGQNPPEEVVATETEAESFTEPVLGGGEPAPDANVGASVQALTSPVAPGENASISVRTIKGAECSIVVEYDEVKSEDSGLIPKLADEYGMVSWAWTVEASVPEGEWPIEVTCERNEKSGVVQADLVVGAPSEEAN